MYELVTKFTLDDWVTYLDKTAKKRGLVREMPRGVAKAAFNKLVKAFENKYLLIGVIDFLLEDEGYASEIGITEQLLSLPVFVRAIWNRGGYDEHWQALYFRRFSARREEAEYFDKWLSIYSDAKQARVGSVARVGNRVFGSWEEVAAIATKKLDKGVRALQKRWRESGPLESNDWAIEPITPGELPKVLRRMYEEIK